MLYYLPFRFVTVDAWLSRGQDLFELTAPEPISGEFTGSIADDANEDSCPPSGPPGASFLSSRRR